MFLSSRHARVPRSQPHQHMYFLWGIAKFTRPDGHFKVRATLNRFWLSTQINCHQEHASTYSWNRVTPFTVSKEVGIGVSSTRSLAGRAERSRLGLQSPRGHCRLMYSWGWNRVTPFTVRKEVGMGVSSTRSLAGRAECSRLWLQSPGGSVT